MTTMIAQRDTHYAGVTRKPGERYDVEDRYVSLLVKTGAARVADSEQKEKRKGYSRRDMRAAD